MAQPLAFWGAGVSWATQAGANGGLTQACGGNTGQVDQFRGAGPLMLDISAWPARASLSQTKAPARGDELGPLVKG
jgi:hypothetical protein